MARKRPSLHRQLRPCVPRLSTSPPQCWHWCGWHKGAPRRSPTAIQIVSSSMRRPQDAIGRAFNQAHASFEVLANKRALDLSSDAFSSSDPLIAFKPGVSHALCEWDKGASGGNSLCPLDHSVSAKSTSGYEREPKDCSKI